METKQYQKKYINKFTGFYLYIIKDLDEAIKYIGATTNYKTRFSNHICKNVKATKEFIENGSYTIQYLNLNGIVNEEIELYMMENELIKLYDTELNAKNKDGSYRLTDTSTIEDSRMFELLSYIHSFEAEWITYCTKNGKKNILK